MGKVGTSDHYDFARLASCSDKKPQPVSEFHNFYATQGRPKRRSRWRQIELDRPEDDEALRSWEPFAKAFGSANHRVLDSVPLDTALKLRKEGRLAEMRSFLSRVWTAAQDDPAFSADNARRFADEFGARFAEAELEWNKIDADLAKFASGEAFLGGLASTTADGAWLPWLLAAGAAAVNIGVARRQRRDLLRSNPAAFFLATRR